MTAWALGVPGLTLIVSTAVHCSLHVQGTRVSENVYSGQSTSSGAAESVVVHGRSVQHARRDTFRPRHILWHCTDPPCTICEQCNNWPGHHSGKRDLIRTILCRR